MQQIFTHQGRQATSLKALAGEAGLPGLTIDPESVAEYFKFGYVTAPFTFFQDVARADGPTSPPPDRAEPGITADQARDLAQALLRDIMQRKLTGRAGPAGLFLSSGLDSCAIACAAEVPLLTYTLCFEGRSWNENDMAQRVSAACGHTHRDLWLNADDLYTAFDTWIAGIEQPYSHPNALPTWIAMKRISEETDLVIDGSGADDVMGHVGRITVDPAIAPPPPRLSPVRRLAEAALAPLPLSVHARLMALLSDGWVERFARLTQPAADQQVFFDFWRGAWYPFLLGRAIALRPETRALLRDVTAETDLAYFLYHRSWAYEAAMGRGMIASGMTGMEFFMPLATPEYTDLFLRFPPEALFVDRKPKHMLLDLIRQKDPGYTYGKQAIRTPWSIAFRSETWRHDVENLPDLLPTLNADRIRRVVRQHTADTVNNGDRILNLMVLGKWLAANGLMLPERF